MRSGAFSFQTTPQRHFLCVPRVVLRFLFEVECYDASNTTQNILHPDFCLFLSPRGGPLLGVLWVRILEVPVASRCTIYNIWFIIGFVKIWPSNKMLSSAESCFGLEKNIFS